MYFRGFKGLNGSFQRSDSGIDFVLRSRRQCCACSRNCLIERIDGRLWKIAGSCSNRSIGNQALCISNSCFQSRGNHPRRGIHQIPQMLSVVSTFIGVYACSKIIVVGTQALAGGDKTNRNIGRCVSHLYFHLSILCRGIQQDSRVSAIGSQIFSGRDKLCIVGAFHAIHRLEHKFLRIRLAGIQQFQTAIPAQQHSTRMSDVVLFPSLRLRNRGICHRLTRHKQHKESQ